MLVEEVSGESEVKSKALQTSFDLLGETLKFNPRLFQVFNNMVVQRAWRALKGRKAANRVRDERWAAIKLQAR